jgi:hypothetical protein
MQESAKARKRVAKGGRTGSDLASTLTTATQEEAAAAVKKALPRNALVAGDSKPKLEDYTLLKVLGRGSFGKV